MTTALTATLCFAGSKSGTILIVEPRLREQFEVPRPDTVYTAVLAALPRVFVGTQARLAALVAWMAARMRDSFVNAGIAVPPWRAQCALLAKWRLQEGGAEAAPLAAPAAPAVARFGALPIRRGSSGRLQTLNRSASGSSGQLQGGIARGFARAQAARRHATPPRAASAQRRSHA